MDPSKEFATADSTAPIDTTSGNPLADLLQGLPRDAATIGVSTGQAIANMISKQKGYELAGTKLDPKEMGPLGPFLLGDQPIEGLADTAAKYESSIKQSAFAKKYGLDEHATMLGVLGATAPIGFDFFGAGGEGSVIEQIAKASTAEEVAPILRNIGLHEDLIPSAAEHLAATTDRTEIKSTLDALEAAQKSLAAKAPEEATHAAEGFAKTDAEVANAAARAAETAPEEVAGKIPEEIPKEEIPSEGGFARQAAEDTAPKAAAKATRSVDELSQNLENLMMQKSFLEDSMLDHPGKALTKFRSSSTGELPEIRGRTAAERFGKMGQEKADRRGSFNRMGDTIIQEIMGQEASKGGDIEAANQALAAYTDMRDEYTRTNDAIRAVRAELRDAKQAEKLAAEEARARAKTTKAVREAKFEKDYRTKAEREAQAPRGLLQRGAEMVRGGRERPINPNMARGVASESVQRAAANETYIGGIESGPFKGFSPRMRSWYQDWIFQRQAVPAEVKVALKPFEVLKGAKLDEWGFEYLGRGLKTGKDGVVRVVEGLRSRYGMFGQVEKTLNRWLDEEQRAGINVAEKENYLPIYLKGGPAGAGEDELMRRLGLRPGFSMRSDFKDYVEAMEAGYQPKYDTIYEILQARARAHYKAMADANMFREGVQMGWIVPKKAIADDMRGAFRDLDSERFPTQSSAYGNSIYQGVYSAPAKLAEKINNYLADPDKTLSNIAGAARTVKNVALAVGVPGTGLSIHFWNVLPREIALDFALSPMRAPLETAKYAYYAINPRAASRFIEKNLPEAMPLIRAGMKFSTEEHEPLKELAAAFEKDENGIYKETLGSRLGTAAKSMAQWIHNIFGANTFDKLLPARKIGNGIRLYQTYLDHGFPAADAARRAASDINAVYGGINWESLGRSRNWQGVLQSIAMAPDYAETNLRLGGSIAKAFANPKSISGKIYRGMAYFYLGSYMTMNLINYENTGHWSFQNDILHQFSLDLGKAKNGKERYLNIYGTGVDFLRIPLYAATAIAKGNIQDLDSIFLNRMSIPLRSAMSMLLNVDWKGDPILGPDKYGKPQSAATQAANALSNTVGQMLPSSAQPLGNLMAGKTTPATAIEETLGLPVTEKNIAPSTADINKLKSEAADAIANGDYSLFNKLVAAKVISPRSRATFIRDALTKARSARQLRAAQRAKAKTAQEKQLLQQEGFTAGQ
ncbi:MAG: hypothetical protein KGI03_00990 [Patescibacteria group bacterium]|nr:hypothetical protein [Patescibacteria group bacterium]